MKMTIANKHNTFILEGITADEACAFIHSFLDDKVASINLTPNYKNKVEILPKDKPSSINENSINLAGDIVSDLLGLNKNDKDLQKVIATAKKIFGVNNNDN